MAKQESLRRVPGRTKLTAETPLTVLEQKFITHYIQCGSPAQALREAGIKLKNNDTYSGMARRILRQPNVEAELCRIMEEELKPETVATANEVMSYFTGVMRGEVKDQFGLDAPIAERTKAAQELAKRTIDIENRKNGAADQKIEIKLDWGRN